MRATSSKLWRTLLPHFQNLAHMSRWQLGKGNVSFWHDNWCGEVLGTELDDDLSVKDGLAILSSLVHRLSEDQKRRVELVELDPREEDRIIFSY